MLLLPDPTLALTKIRKRAEDPGCTLTGPSLHRRTDGSRVGMRAKYTEQGSLPLLLILVGLKKGT